MLEEETLEIHVDGSVTSNKVGGIAVRIVEINSVGEEVFTDLLAGQFLNARSTQLEVTACTFALREAERKGLIKEKKQVVIFTDSKYVSENYQEAKYHWVGKNWLMRSGRPAPDAKEWSDLIKQLRHYWAAFRIDVRIKWEKGHSSNHHNNAVDVMARDISRQPTFHCPKSNTLLAPSRSKKLSGSMSLPSGFVKMDGQIISIKVLDCEYLRKGIWSYKYAIEPDAGSVGLTSKDKIFSKYSLAIGNTYRVRINFDNKNPWIEQIYP